MNNFSATKSTRICCDRACNEVTCRFGLKFGLEDDHVVRANCRRLTQSAVGLVVGGTAAVYISNRRKGALDTMTDPSQGVYRVFLLQDRVAFEEPSQGVCETR